MFLLPPSAKWFIDNYQLWWYEKRLSEETRPAAKKFLQDNITNFKNILK